MWGGRGRGTDPLLLDDAFDAADWMGAMDTEGAGMTSVEVDCAGIVVVGNDSVVKGVDVELVVGVEVVLVLGVEDEDVRMAGVVEVVLSVEEVGVVDVLGVVVGVLNTGGELVVFAGVLVGLVVDGAAGSEVEGVLGPREVGGTKGPSEDDELLSAIVRFVRRRRHTHTHREWDYVKTRVGGVVCCTTNEEGGRP